jgi:hypothetical protein
MNEGSKMNNAIPFKKLNVPETDFMYYFAKDCATHKYNGDCNRQCKDCASNIIKYGIDPQQAVMLQHAAELKMDHVLTMRHKRRMEEEEYEQAKARNARSTHIAANGIAWTYLIGFPLIIFIFLFNVKGCFGRPLHDTPQPAFRESVAPQQNHRELPPPQVQYRSEDLTDDEELTANTWAAMVAMRIYDVDMNGDGKINCIDYTLQYWQYYPNQDYIRIIWNNNPYNGFNHLFVYMLEVPVEPQGGVYNGNMHVVWGDRYDPKYDRDVTDLFDQIKYSNIKWSEYVD